MEVSDLVIGERLLRYFPRGASLDAQGSRRNIPDEIDEAGIASDHPRIRRAALCVGVSEDTPMYSVLLHWSDETDLDVLDELVAARNIDDELFQNFLVGEFLDHICRSCGLRYRIVDDVAAIPLPPGDPIEQTNRQKFHTKCPNCDAPTRRMILEFVRRLVA